METPSLCVRLEVDHREAHLMQALRKMDVSTPFVSCNMDGGDVRLWYGDTLVSIIERKTIADLDASIKDGRHRDQKGRLLANYDPSKIMYIIEGDAFLSCDANDRVRGALINTLFRDHLKVMVVANVAGTASFLSETCKRIQSAPNTYLSLTPGPSIVANAVASIVSHKRNACLTKDTFAESTLSLVPGVSPPTAKKIMEKYGSLLNLLQTCSEKDIADIKTGSGRRIGNKVAQRVVEFIGAGNAAEQINIGL